MCEAAGFANVRTYIASGNVLFSSALSEANVKAALEKKLRAYFGKSVAVLLRTDVEMAAVLANNPFPNAAPNRVVALFLDDTPAEDAHTNVMHRKDEQLALGTRQIYIHYADGLADSKLKLPAAQIGTARNMNMIAKLSATLSEI